MTIRGVGPLRPENFYVDRSVPFISRPKFPSILTYEKHPPPSAPPEAQKQQKDRLVSESQWNRLKLREGRLLQRGLLMYVPFFLPGIWWQTHLIQHPAPVGCDGFGWVKLGTSYILAPRSAGAVLRNRVLFGEKFKYSLQPSICEKILQSVVDISASSLPSQYSRMPKKGFHLKVAIPIQFKGYLFGWAINICLVPRVRFLHSHPPGPFCFKVRLVVRWDISFTH